MECSRLPSPEIRVPGHRLRAKTYLTYAGAYQLTLITTVFPVLEPPVELQSSYLGHPNSDAVVSHLEILPYVDPTTVTELRPGQDLLVEDRRACLLDHLGRLQDLLAQQTDGPVTIDLADDALHIVENA